MRERSESTTVEGGQEGPAEGQVSLSAGSATACTRGCAAGTALELPTWVKDGQAFLGPQGSVFARGPPWASSSNICS